MPIRILAMLVLLAGCAMPDAGAVSPPEASGLIAVRGYPQPDSACQVIGENAITNRYLDHTALLIGCPVTRAAAIEARQAEGGRTLTRQGAWLLISLPRARGEVADLGHDTATPQADG